MSDNEIADVATLHLIVLIEQVLEF
jgi:hypothetical protein